MNAATRDASEGPGIAIIAAGHRLVGVKGADFTIHELVREANVALQTFYRYFGSKDQLLVALIADQIREHTERLRAAAASERDAVARLRYYIRATLTPMHTEGERARAKFIASEHWRLHQILPEQLAAATQPFTDLVASELEAGATSGVLHPRNVTLDAWLITRTVMSAVHHYVFIPGRAPADVADELCEFCVAAAGGQPRPLRRG